MGPPCLIAVRKKLKVVQREHMRLLPLANAIFIGIGSYLRQQSDEVIDVHVHHDDDRCTGG